MDNVPLQLVDTIEATTELEGGTIMEKAFPHASMCVVPNARLFVGIDQPLVVSEAIADLVVA